MMKQISRWYDVEVQYERNTGNPKFYGKIQMSLNLSQVLKILDGSNRRFILEGKKIIVRP